MPGEQSGRLGAGIESALFGFACLALIWVPLPGGSKRLWASLGWSGAVLAIAGLCFVCVGLGVTRVSPSLRKAWPALLCLILLQFWVFLQWLPGWGWSLDRTATLHSLLIGCAYTALFATLLQVCDRVRIRRLYGLLFFCGLAQAVYAVAVVQSGAETGFFVEKHHFTGVTTGTFVNPNHFAAYLNLILAVGVARVMTSTISSVNSAGQWLNLMMSGTLAWRLSLVILVVALVMSHSRMGNLAFAVSLFAGAGFYMLIKRRLILAWVLVLGSIVLVDALLVGARFGSSQIVESVAKTVVSEERRVDLIAALQPMVSDFWMAGAGAGSFYSVFPGYRQAAVGSEFYYHAHNDYLEFLIELGLPGVLLLVLFVAFTLRACYLVIRNTNSTWSQVGGYAGLMAVVAIAAHSIADFSLRIPGYAAIFMAIMAGVYISGYGAREHSLSSRKNIPESNTLRKRRRRLGERRLGKSK